MDLDKFRDAYYDYTNKASDAARKLSFAGIAIIWVFRAGDGLASKLPEPLLWPILLFATALGSDLLQYVWGGLAWSIFCRMKEKGHSPVDADMNAPAWINWPTNVFYYLKIGLVVVGYAMMIAFLARQVVTS